MGSNKQELGKSRQVKDMENQEKATPAVPQHINIDMSVYSTAHILSIICHEDQLNFGRA